MKKIALSLVLTLSLVTPKEVNSNPLITKAAYTMGMFVVTFFLAQFGPEGIELEDVLFQ